MARARTSAWIRGRRVFRHSNVAHPPVEVGPLSCRTRMTAPRTPFSVRDERFRAHRSFFSRALLASSLPARNPPLSPRPRARRAPSAPPQRTRAPPRRRVSSADSAPWTRRRRRRKGRASLSRLFDPSSRSTSRRADRCGRGARRRSPHATRRVWRSRSSTRYRARVRPRRAQHQRRADEGAARDERVEADSLNPERCAEPPPDDQDQRHRGGQPERGGRAA